MFKKIWAWVFPQPEEPQVEDEVAQVAATVLEEVLTSGSACWWFEDPGLGRAVEELLTQSGWVFSQKMLLPSRGAVEFSFSV
ncbi:hypothetical protein C4564_04905 [Candidatus Microgenomates bacterium]|nr:MAG: hypothetical protein C4564_04905 [Candidatus Microgenomates bacterium]